MSPHISIREFIRRPTHRGRRLWGPGLMIKFNRIGNKLGLVGLLGIALAVGMSANQMMTESAVTFANQQAVNEQVIAGHTVEARVGLRRMQMAERDIRLSVTPEE